MAALGVSGKAYFLLFLMSILITTESAYMLALS